MSLHNSTHSPLAQKITQGAYVYPYANRRERYALIRGKSPLKTTAPILILESS